MRASPLVLFYRGCGTDQSGRLLSAIHGFAFRELEHVHDYIQWLFPLVMPSVPNPHAPLLTEQDRAAFHSEFDIRNHYRTSLELMWEFYGFRAGEGGMLERTGRWEERRDNWLTPDNHNHKRITRILRSSMLCGFMPEARSFFAAVMEAVAEQSSMAADAPQFWEEAVETVPAEPAR